MLKNEWSANFGHNGGKTTMLEKGRVSFSEYHTLGICGSAVKTCLHWSAYNTNWAPRVRVLKMNDKKIIFILWKILDKIQEYKENAKKVEESITAICKEEGVSFEQVFYILFFNAHPPAFRVESLFYANW